MLTHDHNYRPHRRGSRRVPARGSHDLATRVAREEAEAPRLDQLEDLLSQVGDFTLTVGDFTISRF